MACVRKYRGKRCVDWRDPSGKRFIETVDGNRADAEQRLAEIVKTGKRPASKRLTFEDYGNWWLEKVAKVAIKGSTYEEYERVLKVHVYPLFGSKPFVKIDRSMIRQLIAAKKSAGLSQSTIRNIIAPVRGIFFQAIDDGNAHNNPAARIGKLNKRAKDDPRKKIDPLSREELQVLLQTAKEKHPTYYPLFLAAARSGLRQGELLSLKGIDLDFKGRFIHVQRNLSRSIISATKNGKERRIDMSTQLAETLNELLSKRRSEALRREMERPAEERRDAAAVVNEVMEAWLFQTPETVAISEAAKRRRL